MISSRSCLQCGGAIRTAEAGSGVVAQLGDQQAVRRGFVDDPVLVIDPARPVSGQGMLHGDFAAARDRAGRMGLSLPP
jgi:hypothetical protein